MPERPARTRDDGTNGKRRILHGPHFSFQRKEPSVLERQDPTSPGRRLKEMPRYAKSTKLRWALAVSLAISWLGWAGVVYDIALYVGHLRGDTSLPYWPPMTTPLSYVNAVVAISVPSVLVGLLSVLIVLRATRWQIRSCVVVTTLLVPGLLWEARLGRALGGPEEIGTFLVLIGACLGVFWCAYRLARESRQASDLSSQRA